MSFAKPEYSKNEVNRAGRLLAGQSPSYEEIVFATGVLANWRACHLYPINTFQATLRGRVGRLDAFALVAQRLKRAPSVITKLQRFPTMNLAQMQDIGGLRAVLSTVAQVRRLQKQYMDPKSFQHSLVSTKDYIDRPKPDGYRSVHLVFKYKNDVSPQYDGLHLELQFRTRLQHAWATAVETMGTFLGQALKSGKGDDEWRRFFAASSAALTHFEKTTAVPGYETLSPEETYNAVKAAEGELGVLSKLQGFAIAASRISTDPSTGSKYHLVVLNSEAKTVRITPFSEARLAEASEEYAKIERLGLDGHPLEAVLVSAGPVDALKKAYPNYFLDTHQFVAQIKKIIGMADAPSAKKKRRR